MGRSVTKKIGKKDLKKWEQASKDWLIEAIRKHKDWAQLVKDNAPSTHPPASATAALPPKRQPPPNLGPEARREWERRRAFQDEIDLTREQMTAVRINGQHVHVWTDTFRWLAKIHSSMKQHTEDRNAQGRSMELTLTELDLLDILAEQQGLCYYLGIPMNLRSKAWWMCTVESASPPTSSKLAGF